MKLRVSKVSIKIVVENLKEIQEIKLDAAAPAKAWSRAPHRWFGKVAPDFKRRTARL